MWILRRSGTVSYTHLDVYKRQAVLVMSLLKVGIIATTVQTVIVLAVFVYISVVHNRASKIFW